MGRMQGCDGSTQKPQIGQLGTRERGKSREMEDSSLNSSLLGKNRGG